MARSLREFGSLDAVGGFSADISRIGELDRWNGKGIIAFARNQQYGRILGVAGAAASAFSTGLVNNAGQRSPLGAVDRAEANGAVISRRLVIAVRAMSPLLV